MDLALEAEGTGRAPRGSRCFNPCFYGSCSRSSSIIANEIGLRIRVSILVFMDLALEARAMPVKHTRKSVSILVFMDLALEVHLCRSLQGVE